MNLAILQQAVGQMKRDLEAAIRTGTFGGANYDNGQRAKEALIRSQRLILRIHEAVKQSLAADLDAMGQQFTIYPAIGQSSPELKVAGFIKAKDQDVVVLFDGDRPRAERITEGPLNGEWDEVGRQQSERSIVVGVRSQMSSVAKNFDTLMERAFAETLNLRLRLPGLTMGEVYVLPVVEYDDVAMVKNQVAWKRNSVGVEKFIRTFLAITHRRPEDIAHELYKYERSALVLVDFRPNEPRIFTNTQELKDAGLLRADSTLEFSLLSPAGFAVDLITAHQQRLAVRRQS